MLQYALDSCVAQTHRPLELVVVNDGGVDVSDILDRIVPTPQLHLRSVVHATSQGRGEAGNAGLRHASGAFLGFLDDDDWLEPTHVATLLEVLARNPGVLAAYADVSYRASPDTKETHRFDPVYDPVALRLENSIPIHAVLFSRQLLEQGCRLDPGLEVFEDWDFWLQCAEFTTFEHVGQVTAGYRAGGDSSAGWGQSAEQVARARQRLLAKWQARWTPEQLDQALRWPQERLDELRAAHSALHQAHANLCADHAQLHREFESRAEGYRIVSAALEELQGKHADLIEAHQRLDALHAELLQAQRILRAEQGELQESYKRIDFLYREAADAYAATLASTSWRLTRPIRLVSQAAQGVKANGRALIRPFPALLGAMRDAARVSGGWHRLALKVTSRVRRDGLGSSVRRVRFHMLRRAPASSAVVTFHDKPPFCPSPAQLAALPAVRCGIMAHVFFMDLFPELCGYLRNMPIPYRLLVSVTRPEDREHILAQRGSLGDKAELIVKVLPNRGRDIAPLLVGFRDEIADLEIIGHIHTKKSSYIGSRQFGEDWRGHLLQSMLGDPASFPSALAQFAADPTVGIIYPETFPALPYWAHTWLSNRAHAEALLASMGFADIDFGQYIDYPAGSMFWARTEALKPLFDLGLSLADFPPEQGQTDNTLHHAIERCLVFSAQAAGLSRRLQFREQGRHCFRSYSAFVVNQYAPHALAERLRLVCGDDRTLSFDLFDTLIWRPFARPEAVFWMLEERIAEEFGIEDFTAKRRQAESMARALLEPGQDVGIAEIHRVLGELLGLDAALGARLLELEIATEQALFSANPVLAELVGSLRRSGRRMVLVSDMYLGEAHLRPVLRRLGLDFFDRLYVSADTGRRKDRGDVWDYLLEREGIDQTRLQHVGDNEHSDVQVLVDRGFNHPVHVMRPAALLGVLPGGKALIGNFRRRSSWRNELMLGLIANRVCRDLTSSSEPTHRPFADPSLFGYGVIGPILFVFMAWLIGRVQRDAVTSLRFLSREGWLLERAYQAMRAHSSLIAIAPDLPVGAYFYCSRSVVGLAAIQDESDLSILLSSHYDGSFRQLLTARFGLADLASIEDKLDAGILDQRFRLPDDHFLVLAQLRRCLPELIASAAKARALNLAYWAESSGPDDTRPAIVDIGYSGTIQLALTRVVEQSLQGYYFVTNASAGRVLERGGGCDACFGNLLPLERMDQVPMHRYALLLEAVLTSPEGQLAGFVPGEGRVQPCFKPPGASQRHFTTLERIHDGALDFCQDLLDVIRPEALLGDWDLEAVSGLLPLIVERALDIGSLSDSLSVEDQYCGNQELSVLEFYDRHRPGG